MLEKNKKQGERYVDGLYLHIPFCAMKCEYCDFCTYINMEKEYGKYTEYIIKELNMYPKYKYNTVYFGGGTPSVLPIEMITKIFNNIEVEKNAEITLELNPNDMKKEKLRELRELGINRLSIGIQSFQDHILKFVGRDHNGADAIRVFKEAREVGFDNITIDLMFGIPNQTMEDLKKDLEIIKEIEPDNVSIYSLIWEEGTIFFGKLKRGILKEMEQDLEAEMFETIINFLKGNGYNHYEISNFSKKGMEGRHNLKYWRNEQFLGVGMSAASFYKNRRYSGVRTFKKYYSLIDKNEIPIDEKSVEIIDEIEKEKLRKMLGLRLVNEGILYFADKNVEKLVKDGLLEIFKNENKEKRLRLTQKGILLANNVFMEFI